LLHFFKILFEGEGLLFVEDEDYGGMFTVESNWCHWLFIEVELHTEEDDVFTRQAMSSRPFSRLNMHDHSSFHSSLKHQNSQNIAIQMLSLQFRIPSTCIYDVHSRE